MAEDRVSRAARWCFAAVAAFSALALGAALAGQQALLDPWHTGSPVAPTTAALLLWISVAAWLAQRRDPAAAHPLDHITAAGVLVTTAFIGVSFFVAPAWNLDYWLFPSTVSAAPADRMAPLTAAGLAMAGAAFSATRPPWSHRRALRQTAALLSVAITAIAMSVVAGYALQVPGLYGGVATRTALLTAMALAVLGMGLLLTTREDTWPMELFRRPARGDPGASRLNLEFLGLGALFAVAITFFGSEYFRYQQIAAKEIARIDTAKIADIKKAEVANWYRDRQADADTVLSLTPLLAWTSPRTLKDAGSPPPAAVVAWMEAMQKSHRYRRIEYFDAHGARRAAAPLESVDPVEPEAAGYVTRALHGTEVVIEDLHRPNADGPMHMALYVPVRSDTGVQQAAFGVLAFTVDPADDLFRTIQTWPFSRATSEILLVRREGTDVVFLTPLRLTPGEDTVPQRQSIAATPELPATRAVMGFEGEFETLDYKNVPVLAAIRRVPGTPWFLVAKIYQADMYTPVRKEAWTVASILWASLLASVMAVGLLWHERAAASAEVLLAVERDRLESGERLRLALEAVNQGTFDLNVQTGEMLVSSEYARLIGYDPQTFRETEATAAERLHPDDRERATTAYRDYVEGKARKYHVEFRQKTADGGWRWLLSMGKIVERDAEGRPLRMLGTHADIHARKLAEEAALLAQAESLRLLDEAHESRRALLSIVEDQKEAEVALRQSEAGLEERVLERTAQLEAANKELEAFSYSVSHDLRAPLRAVSGYARILCDDYARVLDAQGKRFLGVVQGEAERMGHLIDGLLRFSHLGRQTLQKAPVDMTAMVRDVCREVRAAVPNERVVEIRIADLPGVEADAALVRHVWMNLLGNAFKFTAQRERSVIEVDGAIEGAEAVYSVRDNGAGFDMKYSSKLFGVFQRLHGQSEFEGTGVGLALVQRIVQRHGGRTWAEGESGRGATFYFTIPAQEKPPDDRPTIAD